MDTPKLAPRMKMLGALSSALGRVPASAQDLMKTTRAAVADAVLKAKRQPVKLNRKQRRVQRALRQIQARQLKGAELLAKYKRGGKL